MIGFTRLPVGSFESFYSKRFLIVSVKSEVFYILKFILDKNVLSQIRKFPRIKNNQIFKIKTKKSKEENLLSKHYLRMPRIFRI